MAKSHEDGPCIAVTLRVADWQSVLRMLKTALDAEYESMRAAGVKSSTRAVTTSKMDVPRIRIRSQLAAKPRVQRWLDRQAKRVLRSLKAAEAGAEKWRAD